MMRTCSFVSDNHSIERDIAKMENEGWCVKQIALLEFGSNVTPSYSDDVNVKQVCTKSMLVFEREI